ncbi:hypothetical protein L228DRAFT_176899 [Xylona heveae TC161]|uniref:Uncharacterized protein n=1 Tax=Xylona heveae (strain CBS 132557 / TC161) TaxID=1328760 RepID=A0A165F7P2_XYLHT|nr:hypothetical protein L228DRAFT_176899 [Xylona heveae TC161]KZF20671.1 hypothetical protein L228DRAFT_176899 [Xylona heveae TC161]
MEYAHANEFRLGLGFDVDIETGLIAAARDDRRVQLFSLHTAEKISVLALSKCFEDFPKCVKFSEVPKHPFEPNDLAISSGAAIENLTWRKESPCALR